MPSPNAASSAQRTSAGPVRDDAAIWRGKLARRCEARGLGALNQGRLGGRLGLACYDKCRMKGAPSESRRDILRAAARLFQERGYDATSMQDIAGALNFSKAALYHHFESKEEILQQIMNYGMDIFEQRVQLAVKDMPDAEARLRACIALHIELVISGHDREITVILHENRTLQSDAGRAINARKKSYIVFLAGLIAEVQAARGLKHPAVIAQPAAFALLGMINWMYQWYRTEGNLTEAEIVRQYTALFFQGAFAAS